MQENRAFDHYYGTLKGVRGFNDRVVVPLKSGLPVFYQPTNQSDLTQYMLPFHAVMKETSASCMDAPEMNYPCDIRMWNKGRFDSWNTGRSPGMGMSYFSREDLPYYYTLYDNFAVGDQYFQSTFTQTNPNRLHFFSGSNGLSVGEPAMLDNTEPRPGFNWTTVAELLEAKNISWKVYQQWNNFDDNGFAWFSNFQKSRPGDILYDKGMKRYPSLIAEFEKDLRDGTLPSVSWLIAPSTRSEHATNQPSVGEEFTSRILDRLKSHPKVYAKSAFILNYDEGGQFFDHFWTPTPPLNEENGFSTVSVKEEINTEVMTSEPVPIGLGFRVPLLVLSPWSRGNIVVSEVFDHTSVIKLIENRFGIYCPNISPWRRAVVGDLTSAFDFDHPDYTWPELPETKTYIEESIRECLDLPYPMVPTEQSMPKQEPGVRISRALPYQFETSDVIDFESKKMLLSINNIGQAGGHFISYDLANIESEAAIKHFTVESGKRIEDAPISVNCLEESCTYGFQLMGPNGFFRQFYGSNLCPLHQASLSYQPADQTVTITLLNSGSIATEFSIVDNAYGATSLSMSINGGEVKSIKWDVASSSNWYDITVSDSGCYSRRFGGRMETGADSISDPAMGAGIPDVGFTHLTNHPVVPPEFRIMSLSDKDVNDQKAEHKDAMVHWEIDPEFIN